MKVLHINNTDQTGGAGRLVSFLIKEQKKQGLEVDFYALKLSENSQAKQLPPPENWLSPIANGLASRLGTNSSFMFGKFPFSLGRAFFSQYDIIHYHDPVPMNFAGLAWLSRIRPVVLMLHCPVHYTGYCVYPYNCDRWKKYCGKCPQFGQFPLHCLRRDISFENNLMKRIGYALCRKGRVAVFGDSRWIAEQASESMLQKFSIDYALTGADREVFYPTDKGEAKEQLGIPRSAKTILVQLAPNPLDKRKGNEVIIAAAKKLQRDDLHFIIPQPVVSANADPLDDPRFAVTTPPYTQDDAVLNGYYNAADVMWHPSLADCSPLSIAEAFAAGVPVIASDVGGVGEFFTGAEPGYLVPVNNSEAVAQCTEEFFAEENRRFAMSAAAQHQSKTLADIKLFAAKVLEVYKKVSASGSYCDSHKSCRDL